MSGGPQTAAGWTTAISVAVSVALAGMQFVKWWRDQRSARASELLRQMNAGAQRDTIIVGSAEKAVLILERTLTNVQAEAEHLRSELAAARAEITELRAEIAQLRTQEGRT